MTVTIFSTISARLPGQLPASDRHPRVPQSPICHPHWVHVSTYLGTYRLDYVQCTVRAARYLHTYLHMHITYIYYIFTFPARRLRPTLPPSLIRASKFLPPHKSSSLDTAHIGFVFTRGLSTMASNAPSLSKYVTLVSSDGFEFVVLREAVLVSSAIKGMLDPKSECPKKSTANHTESPRTVCRSHI